MVDLLLVRHEEALPADQEGEDALRALTPEGRTRMHVQARALFDALPGLDHVFTSPLVRATQTAEILVGAFDLATPVTASRVVSSPPSLSRLLQLSRNVPASLGLVAVVGHEPTLSSLAEVLLRRPSLGFRTGQAILVEVNEQGHELRGSWRGGETLAF